MNQQQLQQQQKKSAQARRLKFIRQVEEIIEKQRKQLNESEAEGGDYTIDDICANIKGAIYDEMMTLG
jgi:hypothetical protein